jgi:hypothetical protein
MAPLSPLGLVSVIAGFAGFRRSSGNSTRFKLGAEVLDWAAGEGARTVLFPAGYLLAAGSGRTRILAASGALVARARSHRLAVIVGVDACPPSIAKPKLATLTVAGGLPFFVVAWAPGMSAPIVSQQRSTTSKDWRLAPSSTWAGGPRTIAVAGHAIATALCGEAFSTPVRDAILSAVPTPSVVAVPAHSAKGSRHWKALKFFSTHGVAAIRAVHADYWANNSLWIAGKTHAGSQPPFGRTHGQFWVEASLFD